MLAAPIINPITIISTIMATSGDLMIILGRIAGGFFIASLVGYIISHIKVDGVLKEEVFHSSPHHVGASRIGRVLSHTTDEFFDMGKFLILGSMACGLIQTFIPRSHLLFIAQNPLSSILVMMILAFLLSLCSEVDAFVANSFTQFTAASKLSFLVLGPMLDLKLLFMFAACFKRRIIFLLSGLILTLVFLFSIICSLIL